MTRAYVGLGSNLGDREATINAAVARLGEADAIDVLRVSTLRETDPVGYLDQPRFLNGAAELETTLGARELLERLLGVERELGRDRSTAPPQGPRTVDLDLLLYGGETVAEDGLEIPHPRLHEREFVLEPLVELDPELVVPGHGPVETLLARIKSAEA